MDLGTRNATTHRAFVCAALAAVAFWAAGCGQQQSATAEKEKSETLTAGTEIVSELQSTVDTGKNKVGDKVALRTVEDVRINEVTVVPAGATVNGEVTHIDQLHRPSGTAWRQHVAAPRNPARPVREAVRRIVRPHDETRPHARDPARQRLFERVLAACLERSIALAAFCKRRVFVERALRRELSVRGDT